MITKLGSKLYEKYLEEAKQDIKKHLGYDLGYMKIKTLDIPRNSNGSPNYKMNPDEVAGYWSQDKSISIASPTRMRKVMKHWGLGQNKTDFTKHMIRHELGHELYKNHLSKKDRKFYNKKFKDFETPYLKTVAPEKKPEERFAELVTKLTTKDFGTPYLKKEGEKWEK